MRDSQALTDWVWLMLAVTVAWCVWMAVQPAVRRMVDRRRHRDHRFARAHRIDCLTAQRHIERRFDP